jgi:O-antigen ligase
MWVIVVAPALIALAVTLRGGSGTAFVTVYLPTLLLLPGTYEMPIMGHFNFDRLTILTIFLFSIPTLWREWEWNITDFLLVAYIAIGFFSDYVNKDIAWARNAAFVSVCSDLLPYIVAKTCLRKLSVSVAAAKTLVACAVIVAIVSVYEFRMGANLFDRLMNPFFTLPLPSIAFRYSFARIEGPWHHPILAGMIFAISYRLTRWLEWSRLWPGNVGWLPISKVRFCKICVLVGSAMTLSRGPWAAAIVAALVIVIFRARNRATMLLLITIAIVFLGPPIYSGVHSYVAAESGDEAQQSAAYRSELLDEYVTIAEERPVWGWGTLGFPTIGGMESIDNQYLLDALTNGFYALAVFVALLLWTPGQLAKFAWPRARDDPATALAVTMVGIYVLIAFALTTVWLGAQMQPLLYLIAGWSTALLGTPITKPVRPAVPASTVGYRFARVMA